MSQKTAWQLGHRAARPVSASLERDLCFLERGNDSCYRHQHSTANAILGSKTLAGDSLYECGFASTHPEKRLRVIWYQYNESDETEWI